MPDDSVPEPKGDDEAARLQEQLRKAEEELKKRDSALALIYKKMNSGQDSMKDIGQAELDALSYSLVREQKKQEELSKELQQEKVRDAKLEEELRSKKVELTETQQRLMDTEAELHEMRDFILHKRTVDSLVDELGEPRGYEKEYGDVFEGVEEGEPRQEQTDMKKKVAELLDLVARLGRIKMIDAGIMVEIDKNDMKAICTLLAKKRLIKIENPKFPEPTLVATRHLLEYRRKMMKKR